MCIRDRDGLLLHFLELTNDGGVEAGAPSLRDLTGYEAVAGLFLIGHQDPFPSGASRRSITVASRGKKDVGSPPVPPVRGRYALPSCRIHDQIAWDGLAGRPKAEGKVVATHGPCTAAPPAAICASSCLVNSPNSATEKEALSLPAVPRRYPSRCSRNSTPSVVRTGIRCGGKLPPIARMALQSVVCWPT